MRAPVAIGAALLLPLVLTGCGAAPSTRDRQQEAPAEWSTEHLPGATSADLPTLLVTDRDDALALMVSDDGLLQSHLSRDGAEFEAGEPLDLGEQYASLGDVVRLGDGSWFALGSAGTAKVDGDDELTYDPLALRSDDGLVWERVDVDGFSDAVEVDDVEVAGGRIVAVGAYRTLASPGEGGFEARAWTSTDGHTFTEETLPGVPAYQGYQDESYAGDVVVVDGHLLASGRIGRRAALWRSSDDGATWTAVDAPVLRDAYSISGLRATGSVVVASTAGADVQAIRSEDGGTTWQPVRSLPVDDEAEGWAPLWSGAGRFFTLTGIDDTSWSEPEVCYADLDQCGRAPGPRLVASPDGEAWNAIDLPGGAEVDEIVGTEDGRLLVLVGEADGIQVRTWPAGASLPEAAEPASPETVALVTLAEGKKPEVGVRYHLPLYTHCGIERIWFGDATWRRTDDGPDYETGAGDEVPAGWPVPEGGGNIYGYATLRGDGVLEYTAEDGTVLATYQAGGRRLLCG